LPASWARLEKFDRIAGRVVEQDLLAARPGDDDVPEVDALVAQALDLGGDVRGVEDDPNVRMMSNSPSSTPASRRTPSTMRSGVG
jgi:hypothetical protein